MAKQFTDRTIKALRPKTQRYERMDSGPGSVAGLGVRVDEHGRQRFVLIKRLPGSPNPVRLKLGDYPDMSLVEARTKANEWVNLIKRGIDPRDEEESKRLAEQRRRENTFAAVAEDFIRDKVLPSERKGEEVARDIRREFIPEWGEKPVTDVTPLDVRTVIRTVVARKAFYQAHNLLTTVKRLFNWAIDQQAYGLETSPCDRLKPKSLIGERLPRQRILDDNEIRAFWNATENLGYPLGPLFRMLLMTGQRKSEVAEAHWSEFDLAAKLWAIPPERFKSNATHIVPLTASVIELLGSLPRLEGDYPFSFGNGTAPPNGFSSAKAHLDALMLAELRKTDPNAKLSEFVIHDLRRTVRTKLSSLRIPDTVAEMVIGHGRKGLQRVYDQHKFIDEMREALEAWNVRLHSIVTPSPANVVALRA
jgi:integrase